MKRKNIKGYFDLDYVVLMGVPVRDGKFGEVIDFDPAIIERRISEELILQRVPLRGREITFLRKALGLTFEKFGNSLGYTGAGVLKWERDPEKRLEPMNEASLRSFFAEKLNLKIAGRFHDLVGTEETPKTVEVQAA